MKNAIMKNQPVVEIRKLNSFRDTVDKVFEFADLFKEDLRFLEDIDIFTFYNYVRSLPYIKDPKGEETVVRQKYTIRPDWMGCRDCDDKTLLILSFAKLKNISGRSVVVGQNKKPHHIYPELELNGNFVPADATFTRCKFGERLYNENYRKVFYP